MSAQHGHHLVTPQWVFDCQQAADGSYPPESSYAVYHVAFKGLIVSALGYAPEEKEQLRREVLLGRGTFFDELRSNATHVISEDANGTKCAAALRQGKSVVNKQWCFDSGIEGKALPTSAYEVKPQSHTIASGATLQNSVSEICDISIDSETQDGQYLDSCIIHIPSSTNCKFSKDDRKKLIKLIRRGGATRLDKYDDTVTHIVAPSTASR